MIKVIHTLLFDKWSVTKEKGGQYKKEKKTNNPNSLKNGFVPGGNVSRADAPFQLPVSYTHLTLPTIYSV